MIAKGYNQTTITRLLFATTVFFAVANTLCAEQKDSIQVLEKIVSRCDGVSLLGIKAYSNVALKPFQHTNSATFVTAGGDISRQSEAVETQQGDGDDEIIFNASTYVKHGKTTLWGDAGYTNGYIRSVLWNEMADAQLLYPYVTGDIQGGDMNKETYSFGGGYASKRDRWLYGGALSYKAGQYYRAVDPRPRNITGQLNATIGGGIALEKYAVALTAELMVYKQTSDIDFLSELGQTSIYHLTGLGMDYVRFRSNGFNTNYKGNQISIGVDLVPQNHNGWHSSVNLSRLTMKTLLSDMNKLPMAKITHDSAKAQIGYNHNGSSNSWGGLLELSAYRRSGTENIFGDATASVYPQIGSAKMYKDVSYLVSAKGFFELPIGASRLSYIPTFAFSHRCQSYADPVREWLVDGFMTQQQVAFQGRIGTRWLADAAISWSIFAPTDSHLTLNDTSSNVESAVNAVASDYRFASSVQRKYAVWLGATYALNKRNAINLSAKYTRSSFADGVFGNSTSINATFIF